MVGPYMEAGAKRLWPVIERYRGELGDTVLELGPNRHPLIRLELADGARIAALVEAGLVQRIEGPRTVLEGVMR